VQVRKDYMTLAFGTQRGETPVRELASAEGRASRTLCIVRSTSIVAIARGPGKKLRLPANAVSPASRIKCNMERA
jgi:hypothetical protein